MTAPVPVLAVVGHTNAGKTSLLRTLMRDARFGEVDDRPGVTRAAASAMLHAFGAPVVRVVDTPGLEDGSSLLAHLDALDPDGERLPADVVREFLASPEAQGRFRQEAIALRQVVDADLALDVLDAREPVLARHRDELAVLARCGTPIVPVLNFTADAEARTAAWRDSLARLGLHANAEFDTVVFDLGDERKLLEKVRVLLDDARAGAIDRLIADRAEAQGHLRRTSARLVAELVLDAAAAVRRAPAHELSERDAVAGALRDALRRREQRCVDELLALFRFRPEDWRDAPLPLDDGRWGLDLFSPEALKAFGLRSGSLAAAGALVGLTVDLALHGLSLGAGTALGAAIGGALGAAQVHGRRLLDRARGYTELRVHDQTILLLGRRQVALVAALLRRGHAAMHAIERPADAADDRAASRAGDEALLKLLRPARLAPRWSRLDGSSAGPGGADDPARLALVDALAAHLERRLPSRTAAGGA